MNLGTTAWSAEAEEITAWSAGSKDVASVKVAKRVGEGHKLSPSALIGKTVTFWAGVTVGSTQSEATRCCTMVLSGDSLRLDLSSAGL